MTSLKIDSKIIGLKSPCFLIGEIGLTHEGSLGIAMAYVKALAEAGADAAKFQMHIAEHEGTPEEKFRKNTFLQDISRQSYWQRTAFNYNEWVILKKYTESQGLVFLCSPFSLKSVDILKKLKVAAWKIGSGETNNLPLLEKIARFKQPMLISTGMSTYSEIENAFTVARQYKTPAMLFQCTSRYPCPPQKLGLDQISILKKKFNIPVGFSDHSGNKSTPVAALALGACALEIHVVFSRKCFGPDVNSSLTIDEFAGVVHDIKYLEASLKSKTNKNFEAEKLTQMRNLFTKSIVASRNIKKSHVIAKKDLEFKKPGTGIPASEYKSILNRKSKKNILKNQQIAREDLI